MCSTSKRATSRANGNRPRRPVRLVALSLVVALFWLGNTVDIGREGIVVVDNLAAAKGGPGGGGGSGGGHGGGNGAGHGGHGGHDAASGGRGAGRGEGHGKGRGRGHAQGGPEGSHTAHGHGNASKHGVSASTLGSLNAAHASETARAHAAPNSAVGAIAAFANAVESEELSDEQRIEAAAQALASKANKAITAPVVSKVADLANVEVDDETANAIAERAAEIQGGDDPDGDTSGGS